MLRFSVSDLYPVSKIPLKCFLTMVLGSVQEQGKMEDIKLEKDS